MQQWTTKVSQLWPPVSEVQPKKTTSVVIDLIYVIDGYNISGFICLLTRWYCYLCICFPPYRHICSGLCIEDTQGTVCCQRGYPAIVWTTGGRGDLGGGDRAEDYDKNKDTTCFTPNLKTTMSCQCHVFTPNGCWRDFSGMVMVLLSDILIENCHCIPKISSVYE